MEFLKEFWLFLRIRKKYRLIPIFVVLIFFVGLVVMTQGSDVAHFIYTLFLKKQTIHS